MDTENVLGRKGSGYITMPANQIYQEMSLAPILLSWLDDQPSTQSLSDKCTLEACQQSWLQSELHMSPFRT